MFSITGMPVWEKELGEYEEEELASGEKLKLPMAMMFDNSKSSEMPEIVDWENLPYISTYLRKWIIILTLLLSTGAMRTKN